MSGANVSPLGRNKEEWLVQATDYRKLNEPPRPRLQRNGTIYLMVRRPLLCQGGDFAFPAGCPRRPCPADDLWVTLNPLPRRGVFASYRFPEFLDLRISEIGVAGPRQTQAFQD